MPEFSDSTIHLLRNQLHALDENVLRLYLVEREFNTFARPILNWFVNRPEIISVLDATDILTSSFIKKYGGTPDFWRAYVSVANEEMKAEPSENADLPETHAEPAETASPVTTTPAAQVPAPTPQATENVSGNAAAAQSEPAAVHTEPVTAEKHQARPTSPLQTATTAPQRVRAKAAPKTGAPRPKPPGNLVAVSVMADQDAELVETQALPAVQDVALVETQALPAVEQTVQLPAPAAAAAPAETSSKTREPASESKKASKAKPDQAASKAKDDKPLPVFVKEPERELLFENIRVTLDKLMEERGIAQFKVMAQTVAETAKDYEGISAPISILYALHSDKIFRKHNRTYVTSQQSALKILRLLRHMQDEKGNHLQSTDEELMNEFRTKSKRPPTTRKAASLAANN